MYKQKKLARNTVNQRSSLKKEKQIDLPKVNHRGIVTWRAKNNYKVLEDEIVYECILGKNSDLNLAVGDLVNFTEVDIQNYVITSLLPRKSFFTKTDDQPPYTRQIMAANVDFVVIVIAPYKEAIKTKMIDRCLIAAKRGGIEPIICLNKLDLLDKEAVYKLDKILEIYQELQIPVIKCSAQTGEGIAAFMELIAGKAVVLIGHSGVGKSSLINALAPEVELSTGAIRENDGKGRHTTSSAQLIKLANGIVLMDTPGFRSFSIGTEDMTEIQQYYTEFTEYKAKCKFNNCSHTKEPECQVKLAVRDGKIARERYESYLRVIGQDQIVTPETTFRCLHCGAVVTTEGAGTKHRNHCPNCLYSLHLDNKPGDRAACCGGEMEPVAVWVRKNSEWAIIHRCQECGTLSSNRIAADDNELLLLSLSVKPLSRPPFPLDRIKGIER